MKYYSKLVFLCALLMLPVGYMLDWMALGLSGAAAVLLAGWAGVRLAPKVPQLRTRTISSLHCPLAACIIITGAIAQGIAGWLHLAVLWGVGLFGVLVLPMAGCVHDTLEA